MDNNPLKPTTHKKNQAEDSNVRPPKKKPTGCRFVPIPKWATELLNKYEKIGDNAND